MKNDQNKAVKVKLRNETQHKLRPSEMPQVNSLTVKVNTTPQNDPRLEVALAVAKGALSAIPFVGGVISEVASLFVNPLERRRDAWLQEVAHTVVDIQEHLNRLPSSLQSDERFLTALYQATHVALRTHRQEKHRFLRNALFHIAEAVGIEDEEAYFLRLIDDLTVCHVLILQTLAEHQFDQTSAKDMATLAERFRATSGVDVQEDLFRTFLRDLNGFSLVHAAGVKDLAPYAADWSTAAAMGATERPLTITATGMRFVDFVRDWKAP